MEQRIVEWVHYDNKMKEYNDKLKTLREKKEKLNGEILSELDVVNKEKNELPIFNIHSLKTSISPQVTNTYESYTTKFYKECFTEFLGSVDKADELLKFMKKKRKIEKKYSLKRDTLMEL